jgi:hypothetical protein
MGATWRGTWVFEKYVIFYLKKKKNPKKRDSSWGGRTTPIGGGQLPHFA